MTGAAFLMLIKIVVVGLGLFISYRIGKDVGKTEERKRTSQQVDLERSRLAELFDSRWMKSVSWDRWTQEDWGTWDKLPWEERYKLGTNFRFYDRVEQEYKSTMDFIETYPISFFGEVAKYCATNDIKSAELSAEEKYNLCTQILHELDISSETRSQIRNMLEETYLKNQ